MSGFLRRLRKNVLFRGLPEQQMARHPALPGWVPHADAGGHPGKVLLPSKANPAVKRWQTQEEAQASAPHAEQATRMLGELDARKGEPLYVTRGRAAHPEIRALEHYGYVRIEAEPAHHVHEFAVHLTTDGKKHLANLKRKATVDARHRQVGLLMKAGVFALLLKAEVPVKGHTRRTTTGLAMVAPHLRHLDPKVAKLLLTAATVPDDAEALSKVYTKIYRTDAPHAVGALRHALAATFPGEATIPSPSDGSAMMWNDPRALSRAFKTHTAAWGAALRALPEHWEAGARWKASRAAHRAKVAEEDAAIAAYEGQGKVIESGSAPASSKLRGQKVWLYHGTSSAMLNRIAQEGLRPGKDVRIRANIGSASAPMKWQSHVYLTANPSGPASAAFYAGLAANQHGGDPVVLRVLVDGSFLSTDRDDADLRSGRDQYRIHDVEPHEIMEVDGERVAWGKRSSMKLGMQLGLFGPTTTVHAHVRRTTTGIAPVQQHLRHIEGPADVTPGPGPLLAFRPAAPPEVAVEPAPRKGRRVTPGPLAELGPRDPLSPERTAKLETKLRDLAERMIAEGEADMNVDRRQNTWKQQKEAGVAFERAEATRALGSRYLRLADQIHDGYAPIRFDELMANGAILRDVGWHMTRQQHAEESKREGRGGVYADEPRPRWDFTERYSLDHEGMAMESIRKQDLLTGLRADYEAGTGDASPAALIRLKTDLATHGLSWSTNSYNARPPYKGSDVLAYNEHLYGKSRERWERHAPERAAVAAAHDLVRTVAVRTDDVAKMGRDAHVGREEEWRIPVTAEAHKVVSRALGILKDAGVNPSGRWNGEAAAEIHRALKMGYTEPGQRPELVANYRDWLARTSSDASTRQKAIVVDRSRARDPFDERMARAEAEERKRFIPVDLQHVTGFVETPAPWVERMIEEADIQPGMTVLEPSAGRGGIADRLPGDVQITVAERYAPMREALIKKGYARVQGEALEVSGQFDRVVMNPPWEDQQDIAHVQHAFETNLKPGGKLVAIVSAGAQYRNDRKAQAFRDFLDRHPHAITEIPAEDWKRSGHQVNGLLITIDK